MKITDEAVEAAANAAYSFAYEGDTPWDEYVGNGGRFVSYWRIQAQLSLEAAAPHMLAAAWWEGHTAGRDYQGDGWNSDAHNPAEDNPYRPTE